MFTGIIKTIGIINDIKRAQHLTTVTIESSLTASSYTPGDSINIDGVCSTITAILKNDRCIMQFEYMPETIHKTTVSKWKKKQYVNLEPSLTMNDALGGHFVMGHIDATGTITAIDSTGTSKEITITYPQRLQKFLALKGSVSIDGVSLTISKLEEQTLTVSLIPHTLSHTTLGEKKKDDQVNIEIDMLSRYLKQLFDERDKQTSYEFLKDRGFI
ncbi:riboflavin synthase [Candidatus Peregrinibacteria bacterium]|nr:riboflavin synthase [Candidatus Peregrinibacteria bacterium]